MRVGVWARRDRVNLPPWLSAHVRNKKPASTLPTPPASINASVHESSLKKPEGGENHALRISARRNIPCASRLKINNRCKSIDASIRRRACFIRETNAGGVDFETVSVFKTSAGAESRCN